MNENDTKDCPYCAEPVRRDARICRYCRSTLGDTIPAEAYRRRPGRQIAGVAVALAESLGVSVTFVRLLFIVSTFVSFVGPAVYVALWVLLPEAPGEPPPVERLLRFLRGSESEEGGEPAPLERAARWSRAQIARLLAWLREGQNAEGAS